MIIKHAPGAINPQTDTDKLSDIEAMILEKCEELRQLCFNSKRQLAVMVDAKGRENGLCMQFWNLCMRESKLGENNWNGKVDPSEANKMFTNLFSMINHFALTLSEGNFAITNVSELKKFEQCAQDLQSDRIRYQEALEKIANYDGESIWMDDRDDAANNMLSIARVALGREEEDGYSDAGPTNKE